MKLLTITKLVVLAVFMLNCYTFAAHRQDSRRQQQTLQNKADRLNKPAENENRHQRVERQLARNQTRSELARVENRIATSQPSVYEQTAKLGRNRSNTRIKADQFVVDPPSRGLSRGTMFTHDQPSSFRRDDSRTSDRQRETGTNFRNYRNDIHRQNHGPRVFRSETRHHSFTNSRFRSPQVFSSVVSPYKHHTIYYSYGRRHTFCRVYPYYHQKYIFVSLNGLWPYYPYRRYYTYGFYPYYWYGYYPTTYVIGGYDNLYSYDSGISTIDSTVYADAQEQFNENEEPLAQTPADIYFDAAVAAFADEQYQIAEQNIAMAITAAPDDIVLPYAMVQALFAQGKYTEAADMLHNAVENTPTDQEGVIFARGLYSDQDKLFTKIDELADQAGRTFSNNDLHLLLGYQYLGIGRYNDAQRHLELAKFDGANRKTAAALMQVLEDLRSAN